MESRNTNLSAEEAVDARLIEMGKLAADVVIQQAPQKPSLVKRVAKGAATLGAAAGAAYGGKKLYDAKRSLGGKTRDRIFGRRIKRGLAGIRENIKSMRPYRDGETFAADMAKKSECLHPEDLRGIDVLSLADMAKESARVDVKKTHKGKYAAGGAAIGGALGALGGGYLSKGSKKHRASAAARAGAVGATLGGMLGVDRAHDVDSLYAQSAGRDLRDARAEGTKDPYKGVKTPASHTVKGYGRAGAVGALIGAGAGMLGKGSLKERAKRAARVGALGAGAGLLGENVRVAQSQHNAGRDIATHNRLSGYKGKPMKKKAECLHPEDLQGIDVLSLADMAKESERIDVQQHRPSKSAVIGALLGAGLGSTAAYGTSTGSKKRRSSKAGRGAVLGALTGALAGYGHARSTNGIHDEIAGSRLQRARESGKSDPYHGISTPKKHALKNYLRSAGVGGALGAGIGGLAPGSMKERAGRAAVLGALGAAGGSASELFQVSESQRRAGRGVRAHNRLSGYRGGSMNKAAECLHPEDLRGIDVLSLLR